MSVVAADAAARTASTAASAARIERLHPSYVGACLPIGPDLDCADVPNPVQVVGSDENRLDADHDGWGCESS